MEGTGRRKLEVELILHAGNYLSEASAAEAETVALSRAVDDLGDQSDHTDHALGNLKTGTAGARHELEAFDRSVVIIPGHAKFLESATTDASKAVRKLGDEARSAEDDLEFLDRRIASVQRTIRALESAKDEFGGTTKRVFRQRGLLYNLESLRGAVAGGDGQEPRTIASLVKTGEIAGVAAGVSAADGFAKSFAGAFEAFPLKGALIAALVGVVAGALPMLGGMVAGAVVGGVGTLGLAGGIFAASKDSSVRSAAQQFGATVSHEFFGDGAAFVDPIRESFGILKKDFLSLNLKGLFAQVAPELTIIVSGLGDMVKNLMPGLNVALSRSEPFARAAAHGFSEIGDALSDFLEDVSESHGALEGLQLLFRFTADTILFLGNILQWLSERLHDINVTIEWTVEQTAKLARLAHLPNADELEAFAEQLHAFNQFGATYISDTAPKMGTATEDLTDKVADARVNWAEYQKSLKDVHDEMLGLSDANIAVAKDFAELNDELIKGKKNWDLNSEAGRHNITVINDTIRDLDRQRDSAIKNSDGSVAAIDAINKKYDDQIVQLALVAKQAGATKGFVDALVKDYHFTITADIVIRKAKVVQDKTDKDLALHGFASGGDPPPGLAWVGEHGKELVDFGGNERVYSNYQAAMMDQKWSAGTAGAQPVVVQNEIWLVDPRTGEKTRAVLISEATSRGVPSSTTAAAYP